MKIYKAFRYELKPNNKQRGLLSRCAGVSRFTWNWAIARRNELYKDHIIVDAMDQHREIIELKKTDLKWMKDVSKWIPQESLRRLDRAWDDYNRDVKKGIKKRKGEGVPRMKKKYKHDSFRVGAPITVNSNGVKLPKLGFIRTKENTDKFEGRILAATVNRDADRWFVNIDVVYNKDVEENTTGGIVGVDLGIKDFAVTYDGEKTEKYQAPRPMKNNLRKVKKASRKFSKKKVGSKNFKKEKITVAKIYRKMRYQRKDFLGKLTSSLAKTKSVIIMEDLPTQNLMGNNKLARSIADMGWGMFKRMLLYKTEWYGSKLILIDRYEPSSKTCSICGFKNTELVLSDRVWICQNCGATHDRDENSAKNIRDIGIRILNTAGSAGINACGVIVSPLPSGKADDREARSENTHRTEERSAKSKLLKVV
jgi:putative transposase